MSRRLAKFAPPLALAALYALFVFCGFWGIDLGDHWDEVPWHIEPVRKMVTGGVFLQHAYDYPALSKWFVLMPAWPRAVWTMLSSAGDPDKVQAAMRAIVDAPGYLLTARGVFIVVSGLSMAWVYGIVLVLRQKPWEAFFAAACLGLSWQLGYHSRWVTNDCILTQFGALMLLFLALHHRTGQLRWLRLASVAVGLCMGMKQPGAFMMVPVIVASVMSLPRREWRQQLARLALLGAIAVGVFIITTPGVILEPFVFLRDGRNISKAYAKGHGGFTTKGFFDHVRVVLTFLSVSFFSPFKLVSVGVFATAVWGGVLWIKRDRRFGLILLSFPVGYLAIFCSKYVVMLARNYLQITPFLAVMAARGIADLYERIKPRWARWAVTGALTSIAIVQAVWLIRAADTIRHVDPRTQVRDAIRYVAAHPSKHYRVSDRVRAIAKEQQIVMPPNVVTAPDGEAVVMFGFADLGSTDTYKENDPWLTDATFGPREVDFNWYAVWGGHDRVVVMPIGKAREGGVPLAR